LIFISHINRTVANSPAVITTNSNLENFNKIKNSDIEINEPKVMPNFGINLADLSLRTGSTQPLNQNTKQHILQNMTNVSNPFGVGNGGQIQNSDSYLCGLPAQTFDRFVFTNL